MEIEKMIEEMAGIVCESCEKHINDRCLCKEGKKADKCEVPKKIAELYINKGYRKIPDGAVVLLVGENNQALDERTIEYFVKHNAKVRKETAREIYLEVKNKLWSTLYLPICDEEETDWAQREVLDLIKSVIKNTCCVEVE